MLALSAAEIEKQLVATIQRMGQIYDEAYNPGVKSDDSGWSDAGGPQGLISTSEALECLFIPYWTIPGLAEKFWAGDLIDQRKITASITYLVEGYRSDPAVNGPLGLSGTPYIDFRRRKSADGVPSGVKHNFDFMDTACFLVCALLDARAVQIHGELLAQRLGKKWPRLYDPELQSALDSRIVSCLKLIRECDVGPGQGWAFTNDEEETERTDFIYFTWNALEAIEVVLQHAKMNNLPQMPAALTDGLPPVDFYKSLLRDKLGGLTARFLSPEDSPRMFIGSQEVAYGKDGEDHSHYYNLFALGGLLVCESPETTPLTDAVTFLARSLKNQKELLLHRDHGLFQLAGSTHKNHMWEWGERAFLPLFVKGLARFRSRLKGSAEEKGFLDRLDFGPDRPASIGALAEQYLQDVDAQRLTSGQERKGEPDQVWDSTGYSIYFTERVVEMLCRVYSAWFGSQAPTVAADIEAALAQRAALRPKSAPETLQPRGAAAPVHVSITADVISESIRERILQQVEEAVHSGIAEEIRKQVQAALAGAESPPATGILREGDLILTLQGVMGGLLQQTLDQQFEQDYEGLAKSLSQLVLRVVSDRIERVLYDRLVALRPTLMSQVPYEDFSDRLAAALVFLADTELQHAERHERVDYLSLFTKIDEEYGRTTRPVKTTPGKTRGR